MSRTGNVESCGHRPEFHVNLKYMSIGEQQCGVCINVVRMPLCIEFAGRSSILLTHTIKFKSLSLSLSLYKLVGINIVRSS